MSHNSLKEVEMAGFQTLFLHKSGMSGICMIHDKLIVYNEYLPMLQS